VNEDLKKVLFYQNEFTSFFINLPFVVDFIVDILLLIFELVVVVVDEGRSVLLGLVLLLSWSPLVNES
jgi:hypothetical protein